MTSVGVAVAGAAFVVAGHVTHPDPAAVRPVVHTAVVVDHLIARPQLDAQAAVMGTR